ncbi:hypothetical protein Tco_1385214 [Tanacetum coccineum]
MARRGLHTNIDKDDSEGSDEVSEQDDPVTGTKIPINPVPVAMKTPSIATYTSTSTGRKRSVPKARKRRHEGVRGGGWFPVQRRTSEVDQANLDGIVSSQEGVGVPGQMTYPVASLTLDSARSYVMQGAPFTKRSISSIPIGGSISPEGFLPSILLVVFMVTVVIVMVTLVVVVVMIFGVVVVVDGVSSIIKLLFMIIGFLRIIVFYYLLCQPLGYGNGFL